jgi:hypothetical protein
MKVRFAVAPDSGSLESTKVIAFADALEASGFYGVWLSDLPVAPVVDPLLGVAWPRTACAPSRPRARLLPRTQGASDGCRS